MNGLLQAVGTSCLKRRINGRVERVDYAIERCDGGGAERFSGVLGGCEERGSTRKMYATVALRPPKKTRPLGPGISRGKPLEQYLRYLLQKYPT